MAEPETSGAAIAAPEAITPPTVCTPAESRSPKSVFGVCRSTVRLVEILTGVGSIRLVEPFWSMVQSCLEPGGTVFFVDNKWNATSLAQQRFVPEGEDYVVERELGDRRRFRVVKVFYEARPLEARLAELGWQAQIRTSGEFFLYGDARRVPVRQAL